MKPDNPDFGRFLKAAIARSGKSLTAISLELTSQGAGVSRSTLSAWQCGQHLPVPDERIHALERVLGLAPGELETLLLRLSTGALPDPIDPETRHLQEQLARFSTVGLTDSAPLVIFDQVFVSRDFRTTHIDVTQTIRARRDHLDARWLIHSADTPGAYIRESKIKRCRIGRRIPLADDRTAVEILFDRRLRTGDLHNYQFRLHHHYDDASEPFHRRIVSTSTVRHLEIAVTFARSPRQVWQSRWPVRAGAPVDDGPASTEGSITRMIRLEPAPGTYGVRWSRP